MTEASLELGPWSGNNVFILANSIKKHDMILGRDFLKSNGAVINHGHTLDILGQDIHLNAMEAIGSTWLNNDMQQDFDTLQEVQCEVNSLEIPEPAGSMVTNVIFDTVVKANSQRLVKIHASGRDNFTSNLIIFEPCVPMPVDCLIGRSLHSNEPDIYCNVINAGNTDLTLSKGHEIGSVDEIEDANVSFEKQVDKFQPLDLDMVRQQAKLLKPECHTHLNGMISNEKLSHLERNMLIVLLARHNSVFQWDPTKIGRTKLVEHSVPTGDSQPVQRKQYPIPSAAMQEVRDQTAQMLKDKIIRPSKSPWRSPVLLVKKKNAKGQVTGHRFCIDLTKVNEVTIKDSYPLPLIGNTVDTLSGVKYFSSGDLDRAFWQIGLAEEDKEKFAFVLDGKLFEPNVMLFGSMNAPSTFQRLVDRVLHGLTWKQCLVYLDDVLVFSTTFEQHLSHIHEVLSRFEFANLMLKPSKCNFA